MASEWNAAQSDALAWLDQNRSALSADHMTIWNLHEPSWREYKSSAWYMDRLEREGFEVERGTAGMPTAFRARWSNGPGPAWRAMPNTMPCRGRAKRRCRAASRERS